MQLSSLHRLEFYKRKSNWQLAQQKHPQETDRADTDAMPKTTERPKERAKTFQSRLKPPKDYSRSHTSNHSHRIAAVFPVKSQPFTASKNNCSARKQDRNAKKADSANVTFTRSSSEDRCQNDLDETYRVETSTQGEPSDHSGAYSLNTTFSTTARVLDTGFIKFSQDTQSSASSRTGSPNMASTGFPDKDSVRFFQNEESTCYYPNKESAQDYTKESGCTKNRSYSNDETGNTYEEFTECLELEIEEEEFMRQASLRPHSSLLNLVDVGTDKAVMNIEAYNSKPSQILKDLIPLMTPRQLICAAIQEDILVQEHTIKKEILLEHICRMEPDVLQDILFNPKDVTDINDSSNVDNDHYGSNNEQFDVRNEAFGFENNQLNAEDDNVRHKNGPYVKNKVSGFKHDQCNAENINFSYKSEVFGLKKDLLNAENVNFGYNSGQYLKNEVFGLKNDQFNAENINFGCKSGQYVKNEVFGFKNEAYNVKNERVGVQNELDECSSNDRIYHDRIRGSHFNEGFRKELNDTYDKTPGFNLKDIYAAERPYSIENEKRFDFDAHFAIYDTNNNGANKKFGNAYTVPNIKPIENQTFTDGLKLDSLNFEHYYPNNEREFYTTLNNLDVNERQRFENNKETYYRNETYNTHANQNYPCNVVTTENIQSTPLNIKTDSLHLTKAQICIVNKEICVIEKKIPTNDDVKSLYVGISNVSNDDFYNNNLELFNRNCNDFIPNHGLRSTGNVPNSGTGRGRGRLNRNLELGMERDYIW